MKKINVVGTPNATADVYHYRKPGRKRAPFLRYFRFNLPRLTRAILLLILALIAACAFYTGAIANTMFSAAPIPVYLLAGAATACVLVGLVKPHVWDFGSLVAVCALILYFGTLAIGTPPYVWNGATLVHAAAWNVMMLASLAYLVLMWARWYGMIVAWPEDQNFTD